MAEDVPFVDAAEQLEKRANSRATGPMHTARLIICHGEGAR